MALLSDDDVFGPPKAPAQDSGLLSDQEVFGQPQAPASGPKKRDLSPYSDAVAAVESSDDYEKIGPTNPRTGDYPVGRHQVMVSNIPSWTREALGRQLTPEEFLKDPLAQEDVFSHHFGKSLDRFGNPDDAASVWFTGRPLRQGATRRDMLGTSGAGYVRQFREHLKRTSSSGEYPVRERLVPGGEETAEGPQGQFAEAETGILSDAEVFGSSTQPSSDVPSAAPDAFTQGAPSAFMAPRTAIPEPVNRYQDVGAVPPSVPLATPEAAPVAEGKITEPSSRWSVTRGFVSGLLQTNPEGLADSLEALTHVAPEAFRTTLQGASSYVRDLSKLPSKSYERLSPGFWEIDGLDSALTWAGEAFGQGVASTLPSVGLGVGGAVVGGAVGGPVGATVGAFGGATLGAGALNYGESYRTLVKEGVDPEKAGKIALAIQPIVTGLDVASVGPIIMRLGGIGEVKREITRALARRILAEGAKGATREGVTEALQDVANRATVSLATDKPFWTVETAKGATENFASGFLVGGAFGGLGGIPRDRVIQRPAAEEDITQAHRDMTGAAPTPGWTPTDPETFDKGPNDYFPPERRDGDFAAGDTTVAASVAPDKPIFVSRLRQATEKVPNEGTPEQMLATLVNSPGVKEEELEWTRTREFLSEQKGRVSKADLVQHIEENAIEVKETVYADAVSMQPGEKAMPQYEEYTLPGPRESYRELLLRLPYEEVVEETEKRHRELVKETKAPEVLGTPRGREIIAELDKNLARRQKLEATKFADAHYPKRNIVASARFTQRTDVRGNPVLLAEEIQSDWHQEGRKLGYGTPKGTWSAVQTSRGPGQFQNAWRVTLPDGSTVSTSGVRTEAEAIEQARFLHKAGPPDAPFKSSWQDLTIKRLIRWAADNNITRIGLVGPRFQIARYGALDATQKKGMIESYGNILPSKMKKYAKQLGGTWGTTYIPLFENRMESFYVGSDEYADVFYIDIPPRAATTIQKGMSLFSLPPDPSQPAVLLAKGNESEESKHLKDHTLYKSAQKGVEALSKIAKAMGLDAKVRVVLVANTKVRRNGEVTAYPDARGVRTIAVNLALHNSPIELWHTLTHEYGHVVARENFARAPKATRDAIHAAYAKWRDENPPSTNAAKFMLSRDAVNSPRLEGAFEPGDVPFTEDRISELKSAPYSYWSSFDEWFAEQVARWASSSEKPISIVDKFFAGLAKVLRELHEAAYKALGIEFNAEVAMASWLDSFLQSETTLFPIAEQRAQETRETNQKVIDRESPQVTAAPQQPETGPARRAIRQLFEGNVPPGVEEMAAHADRFNWVYKWGLSLIQVAKRNGHIGELQAYREDVQQMHRDTQIVMTGAHAILKQVNALGRTQEAAVWGLVDDVQNMVYRTPDEVKREIGRHPTADEFAKLVKDRKVSGEGIRAFNNVRKMFDDFLTLNEQNLIEVAKKEFTDPVKLANRLDSIKSSFSNMRRTPYFPHLRFGEHTLTVRDAAGKVLYFETVERSGLKSAERVQNERFKELEKSKKPGETVQKGKLEKDARPLLGMPKALLDLMGEKLELSDTQRAALEQLKFEMAPAQSFRHRFQRRKGTEGYSMDFRRAFATYFFHGAHFYAKTKYVDRLRAHTIALRASTKLKGPDGQLLMPDANRRLDIANFLVDHLKNTLDPKTDWAALRAITFVWALGFSPAAAALNMTQLMVGTFPFLGAHFGDGKAIAAMGRAGAQLATYYKKGTLEGATDADLRALDEGIREGVITEAMAPQLAATAEGRNFGAMGGNVAQRGFMHFMEKSAFMFEMAEQLNRRITFRAAWQLALENAGARFVEQAVRENPQQYQRLLDKGWSEHHARAFVAAKETVEATQYVYAQYARPRFMRGKLGTLFVFKTFVQNTLFMLWNYPSVAVRSLLVMGFIGGLMGLPGGDDVKEILRVLGWQLFGKDFNLEKEARRLIIELTDGTIPPDLILHGLARRGMGIPAVMDAMGAVTGHSSLDAMVERFKTGRTDKPHVPTPILDWSRSVGMGQVLPVQLGEILGPPNKDQSRAMSDQIQRASGAAFGVWFNIYKAATDAGLEAGDPKRWERSVPRAFGAVSKAFRTGVEGRERTRKDATVQTYDVHDTEQLGELIGMGLGFNPLRSSAQWDRIIAEREAQEFYDVRRGILLEQYSKARRSEDKDTVEKVWSAIKKFNSDLPESARGKAISSDTIKQSLMAKQKSISAQESGTPISKRAIGVARDIQSLFPESTVDVRRVR